MRLRSKIQIYIFSAILLVVVSLLFVFMFHFLPRLTEQSKREAERLLTDEISRQLANIVSQIRKISGGERIDRFLIENSVWRWFFEKKLEVIVTDHTRHLYMIYRNEKGEFDLLIFVSAEKHPPDYSLIKRYEPWIREVFETKKDLVLKRENYVSLLKPVLDNGEVVIVIGADFSPARFLEVERSINLMRNLVGGSALIITILLLILVLLAVRSGFIERRIFVDPLTGVYNRNLLSRIYEFIDVQDYSLVLVDVDNFKIINDTYGHDVGDRVLRAIAGRMQNLVKKDRDLIIRYGGEEFLIFVKRDGNRDRPVLVAERIRKAIQSNPVVVNGGPIRVSVSVGVLIDVSEERSLEEAIRKADMALYAAKRAGKNRVEVFREDVETTYVIPFWQARDAVERGDVEFLYQPIYDLNTGEILMLETLVRLRGPDGDLITPDRFIPTLKGTDAYISLTKLIVFRNTEILSKYPDLHLSLNVEATHLSDEDMIEFILQSVEDRCEGRICLEIVEYEALDRIAGQRVTLNLNRLKESGVCLMIDDFGIGNVNLIRMAHAEVDYVKIAGDLIEGTTRERVSVLCKGIVEFCQEIGVQVIAESISSEEVLRTVKEIGIRYGQGYHLSEPRPLEYFLPSP